MKRIALIMGLLWLAGTPLLATAIEKRQILSPVYKIDRKYKSMEGPQSTQNVYLIENDEPELLWIVSFRSEMVGADGATPMLPELMCHVNLDIDVTKHREIFGWTKNVSPRILTLSQGQLSARFPDGYGFPILSTEALRLTTQVLNHNIENPNLEVRHKVTFEFVRDKDLTEPMQPLYNAGVYGMTVVDEPAESVETAESTEKDEELHGTSCLMRPQAPNAMGGSLYRDEQGRTLTGHWVVHPGREVNHTNVTRLLDLPFDTTLHYAAVHVHPFAESLELRDLTTGKTVFKSTAKTNRKAVGLDDVTSFSSTNGVELRKDHEYELISVYNNTTKVDQDSMAVMYLSALDKEFRRPDLEQYRVKPEAPVVTEPDAAADARWLVLRTSAGDLGVKLRPDLAPKTVEQFTRLARAGVFDGVRFTRIEPGFLIQAGVAEDRLSPMTDEQRAMIHKLALETGPAQHVRGMLAMAREDGDPDSAQTSFYIMLGPAPHLDGKYTIFGEVAVGWDVLAELEKTPREGTAPTVRIGVNSAEVIDPASGVKVDLAPARPVISASAN